MYTAYDYLTGQIFETEIIKIYFVKWLIFFSKSLLQWLTDKSVPESVTGVPYDQLTIGVPKEIHEGERRVALSPDAVKQFIKQGFKVVVEAGAGTGAKFLDSDYIAAGAEVKSAKEAFSSDIVLKVRRFRFVRIISIQQPLMDFFNLQINKDFIYLFIYLFII